MFDLLYEKSEILHFCRSSGSKQLRGWTIIQDAGDILPICPTYMYDNKNPRLIRHRNGVLKVILYKLRLNEVKQA